MNRIPDDISRIYQKVKWHQTFADQLVGHHLLRSIENKMQTQVYAITTQKNLKDPENIDKVKVMDMTEMTQLTLSLKQAHKIQFPPSDDNLTNDMKELIKQMEMFAEHVTEQGTVSYFALGEELDCLPRALMICCFAGRTTLQHGEIPMIIVQGEPQPQTPEQSFDEFFENALGEDYSNFSSVSKSNRNRMMAPKRF